MLHVEAAPLRVLYLNPQRFDFLQAALLQGLVRHPELHVACATDGNYGTRAAQCFHGDWHAMGAALASYDVLVVATTGMWGDLPDESRALLRQSARETPEQLRVLLDSCDFGALSLSRRDLRDADVLFKRELFLQDPSFANFLKVAFGRQLDDPVGNALRAHPLVQFPRFVWNEQPQPSVWKRWLHHPIDAPWQLAVFPLPIGFDDRVVRPFNAEPTTEITSFIRPSSDARRLLVEHLDAHHAGTVTNAEISTPDPERDPDLVALGAVSPRFPDETAHFEAYYDALNDSRASISFPGAGYDTARFWEILASGALLISKGIQLEMPDPPVPGEHFLAFETLPELDDAIRFVQQQPDEADAIRRRGQELALQKHSSDAHAAWFVERLLAVRPDLSPVARTVHPLSS